MGMGMGGGGTGPVSLLVGGAMFNPGAGALRVLHRLPFTSDLRRMSVLLKPAASSGGGTAASASGPLLLTKGAPETVRGLLKEVPPNYDSTYLHHMSCGESKSNASPVSPLLFPHHHLT